MNTHFTKSAFELYDPEKERQHGPPTALEHYLNENGEADLYCLTEEREDYERDTGAEIDADQLSPTDFDAFVLWLNKNVEMYVDTSEVMKLACEILKGEGASFEYPGFISIDSGEFTFAFGDMNQAWTGNYGRIGDEGNQMGCEGELPYSATPEQVAQFIREQISAVIQNEARRANL